MVKGAVLFPMKCDPNEEIPISNNQRSGLTKVSVRQRGVSNRMKTFALQDAHIAGSVDHHLMRALLQIEAVIKEEEEMHGLSQPGM